MLDKLGNAILEYMLSYSDTPANFYYDFEEDIDDMAKALSASRDDILASIDYLMKNGYIKYEHPSSIERYFSLDYKGAHIKEFERDAQSSKRREWFAITISLLTLAATVLFGILTLLR